MTSRLTSPRIAQWLFWLAIVGTLALSLAPSSTPLPTTGWDKSNHLLAFAVLTILARFAYPGRLVTAMLGLLAFGALIEVLQSMTQYRFADWADLAADALGILLGAVIGWIVNTIWSARGSQLR